MTQSLGLFMAGSLLTCVPALAIQAAPVKFTADGDSVCVACGLVTATSKSATYDDSKNVVTLEGTIDEPVNVRTNLNEDGGSCVRATKVTIKFDPPRVRCEGVIDVKATNPNAKAPKLNDGKAPPALPPTPGTPATIALPPIGR